jgi:hypothetical protein
MKTQQQSADRKQHTCRQPGAQRSTMLSRSQRSTRLWVITVLVVPILITLLSAALTLLLMHRGEMTCG